MNQMGDSSFVSDNDQMINNIPNDDVNLNNQNDNFSSNNNDNFSQIEQNFDDEELQNNDDNPNIDNEEDISDDTENLTSGKSAGVDPKKNIQKLAGRLSNTLNDYNNSTNKPDPQINKFAANMVLSQAVKGMEEDDIQDTADILEKGKKIDLEKKDKDSKLSKDIDDEIDNDIDNVTESKHYKRITELFNQLTADNDEEPLNTLPNKKATYNNKPFMPKPFEK